MLNICLKLCLNCFVILYYVVLYLAYCINLVIWQCPVADRHKNPFVWGEGPSNTTKNKAGKSYRNQHGIHLKK